MVGSDGAGVCGVRSNTRFKLYGTLTTLDVQDRFVCLRSSGMRSKIMLLSDYNAVCYHEAEDYAEILNWVAGLLQNT